MITLHTFASGSEGNCLLLSRDGTHLLVDAGISARRITAALASLGLRPEKLSGILLTHAHSDHIAGLQTLCRCRDIPLFASAGTARQIAYRTAGAERLLRTVHCGETFSLGSFTVTPFPASHDAGDCVDYRLDGGGVGVGILTDTGTVLPEAAQVLEGAALLVLESNHDVDMLRTGPYPYQLKERILSDYGHLSNESAAAFAARMAQCGTRQIVLAHLSKENNTPALALAAVSAAVAPWGTAVEVAPRSEVSRPYVIVEEVCSV